MTPDVRVVRGAPDDLELAALVAGLAGAAHARHHAPADDAAPRARASAARARRRWRAAAGSTPPALVPEADAWRWSALGAPRL